MAKKVPINNIQQEELSPQKSKPLYLQLKDALMTRIKDGSLMTGERLPSEKEFCALYNVSRITVRQALNELAHEGLIYRRHGKGTFVAKPRIQQELVTITPFEETLRSKGLNPSTRYLNSSLTNADYHLATVLAVPVMSVVVRLELLGLGNDEPMVYYVSYFPQELGQKLSQLARELTEHQLPFSTYDLYEKAGLLPPAMVTQSFEATAANEQQAGILGVKPGAPLLFVSSMVYTAEGRPVEYKVATYCGDKYSFTITRPIIR